MFTEQNSWEVLDFSLLSSVIPKLVTEEQNVIFSSIPSMTEVCRAMFEMNLDSALGSDGFRGIFYQVL